MNAAGRLGLYAAGLVAVFGVSFVAADALVPESVVESWTTTGDTGHDDQDRAPADHGTDDRAEDDAHDER